MDKRQYFMLKTAVMVMWNSRSEFSKCVTLAVMALLSFTSAFADSDSPFRDNHPTRYVVQKGDTLWDVSEQFLKDPWHWPLVWRKNRKIENPELIYPGDLLVVTSNYRIKTIRLNSKASPKTYKKRLERAITTIPPHIIDPFLTSAMIIEPGELDQAGRVLSGAEDELLLGKYTKFYARGMASTDAERYRLFRIGRNLNNPESGELLGVESIHLGDARMDTAGSDVSKLQVISSNQEIRPADRLLPVTQETPLPYYQPHSPDEKITGWIIHAPRGVDEVGRFDVVIVTGGTREGLEEGHVLKAMYHRETRKDPVTGEEYRIPDEVSGLMMVFRTFEKLSYALVMESTRAIKMGDRFESP